MSRPVFLRIDLAAMQHNLQRVRELAPDSKVIAMIKANAYGHGMRDAVKALSDADAFGVACIEEALEIRNSGADQDIVLMEGVFAQDEIDVAAENQFSLVVHNQSQLKALQHYRGSKQFHVWLKVDTGMHRLGIRPEEAAEYYHAIQQLDCVKKSPGLMTHFAQADDLSSKVTEQQLVCFAQLRKTFDGPASLANSAGILGWPETHADWVRPGLMLYGVSPFRDKTGQDLGLKPVMQFTSQLIAINQVKKGERVGYGGSWQAALDTRVGIVAAGYGDGYPQFADNTAEVLVSGLRCPLAGRVSMDMLSVDLTCQPNADVGDEVVLWGKDLPVEVIAKQLNASPYELLTRMTPRPKRFALSAEFAENPEGKSIIQSFD